MKWKSLLLAVALAVSASAQTVTAPVVVGNTIQFSMTDPLGTYAYTIPVVLSVTVGTASVAFTPVPPPPPPPPPPGITIPGNAIQIGIENRTNWIAVHDAGTPGAVQTIVNTYNATTGVRTHSMTYTGNGGTRWSVSLGSAAYDTVATHFVYDVFVTSPNWLQVKNLELDANQVLANGDTVIYGMQCSMWSNTWEYTSTVGGTHWIPSNVPCNSTKFAPNSRHHFRLAYHRNSAGIVTYEGVEVDSVYSALTGAVVNAAKALGWPKGDLLFNVQTEGATAAGTTTILTDGLTIYRW
jgi:hypothetical protein